MNALVAFALRQRVLIVVLLFAVMGVGLISFLRLNIEAYPDPVPPLVDIVTAPASRPRKWSATSPSRSRWRWPARRT